MREGDDVTARVLAEAREAIVDGSVARMELEQEQEWDRAAADAEGAPSPDAGERTPEAEALTAPDAGAGAPGSDELGLGVELAALLGPEAPRLLAAWRKVAARASGLSPSESLALAERQVQDQGGVRG
jgi:hypothetical protein